MSESRAWYSRCAGYRNGDYARTLGMETIGFPVNGVFRGGAYDGRPFWFRCGFRDGYYGSSLMGGTIGFRSV